MSSIADIEAEIIEEFSWLEDPMDRYEHLIELGKKLEPLEEQWKTDERLVKGCQSKVWLRAYQQDGNIYYRADSNTAITKGIIALLIRVLNGQPAKEITESSLGFIDAIQLREHLSSQRSNGLTAMIALMKQYAAHL